MIQTLLITTLLPLTTYNNNTTPTQTKPTTTIDHHAVLTDHEIPNLTTQLITIPNYSYTNPPTTNITQNLTALHNTKQQIDNPDFFATASFHNIVTNNHTQNQNHTTNKKTKINYLILTEFRYSPPTNLKNNPTYFTHLFKKKITTPTNLTITKTRVFRFDHPNTPNSHYYYL